MPEDKDVADSASRFERMNVGSPRPIAFDGSHLPPISTSQGHLSSDIQARIMAFQQKRQNIPLKDPPTKSLPPLPASSDSIPSQLLSSPPIESTVMTPTTSEVRTPLSPTLQAHKASFELSKKPSLSQRRGMKLNMKDMGGVVDPMNLTGELARRLSERKNRPDFKLNLSDTPTSSGASSMDAPVSDASNDSPNPATPKLQGLFANYSKYVDIKSGSLNFAGKASLHSEGVNFSSGSSFHISLDELQFIEELGRGNYGTVSKVLHKPTGVLMAMKEVRLELEETKFAQILMELEVLHKCDSPYIVDFYGAFFVEGAVYMCMEYMDGGSLDKIYGDGIHDEACLAYIAECVIRGLKQLKDQHNIIHRDVKPTNILVNTLGKVKLCDFGVSGNLVASLAKTNIGCQSYMAPERIKTKNPDDATYSVQSDIWSLGLTLLEVAAGRYPYPPETFDNIFSQLKAIVDGEPPRLDEKIFSKPAQQFVRSCLNKNADFRPLYDLLLQSPWLQEFKGVDPHMAEVVTKQLEAIKNDAPKGSRSSASSNVAIAGMAKGRENVQSLLKGKVIAPALHRGGLPNQRLPR
ncbi:CIC11C00000000609 [Sungouiella intermedia]|uniref:mitogen-activated protein kinase kinase n=1 Tax=Sungouiella intermedia TaxID=45354 RepID=A0A1L0GJ61_9ASCO|nr:CIC11C00000000609 [[Candida] intermedia]